MKKSLIALFLVANVLAVSAFADSISSRVIGTDENGLRLCSGGIFKPCICADDVPANAEYHPADVRCQLSNYPGDRTRRVASLVLSGSLKNSFSAVVRTFDNADRSPYEASLCSKEQFEAGLNKCSRWKTQKVVRRSGKTILCLGASGYSKIFKSIRRFTVKVSNRTFANGEKDLRRYCIKSPTKTLNG